MAFTFSSSSDDEPGVLADINVTPLVDVMLVLLIIFMVTAPMLTQGLQVELPAAEGRTFETSATNPATVSIARNGAVYVDDVPVGRGNLELTLGTMLRGRRISRALLRADREVPYGTIVQVVDVMNRAGVEQLGMVTQPWEGADAGRSR